LAVQPVSQPRVEIDLYQDRHRQERNDNWLAHDLFALQAYPQRSAAPRSSVSVASHAEKPPGFSEITREIGF
jgi:hypothetical protein